MIDVVEEASLYGFPNFIADFGGYLGLLLGGSIPGLIEIFKSVFTRLSRTFILFYGRPS